MITYPLVPPIDPVLIQTLTERFPNVCADQRDADREVWMKAGEQRLIAWLTDQLRTQEEP